MSLTDLFLPSLLGLLLPICVGSSTIIFTLLRRRYTRYIKVSCRPDVSSF